MISRFEKLVFGGRLLLLPMYLGLILALLVYAVRFIVKTTDLVWHSLTFTDTEILVHMLGLLDIIMVSHLIVMVMIGGYVLFISGNSDDEGAEPSTLPKLKWLGYIDPGSLKVKMSMSILGVSSIGLLEAFVSAASEDAAHFTKLITVHLVFVVSTVAIALVNRFAFKH